MNTLSRCLIFVLSLLSLLPPSSLAANLSRLTLRNGMVFEGRFASTDEISKNLLVRNVDSGIKDIVIVDDQLRRTFFPQRNLAFPPAEAGPEMTVKVKQRQGTRGARVGSVGGVVSSTPFDEFGRRTITVNTNKGRQRIVQEITEISPIYTRLQSRSVNWDMRIATSSIPSQTLRQILLQRSDNEAAEAHLDLVRILFLSERYQEAARELTEAMKRYPELEQAKLARMNDQLVQQGAQRLLKEIELRRKAGQHNYVSYLLKGFDHAGMATENLIRAAEMLKEYEQSQQLGKQTLELLKPLVEQAEGEPPRLKLIRQLYDEVASDLNIHNLPRTADFRLRAVDPNSTNDEKLAIAMSGWLLGQGRVIQNLSVASSLWEVRNLVREYLRAMGSENRHLRQELLRRIQDLEGGTPDRVVELLAQMKPPHSLPEATDIANHYVVQVPGTPEGFPVKYHVQLPPEYDPYHHYPVVLTLHNAQATPDAQLLWWAGEYDTKLKMRRGQAARHGYIVIAPEWTKEGQGRYEYSAREHHVVLTSLRDACRRFSVDVDRVFISGHAVGGDAAWDIAMAHPDLWAGMILIGARGDYGKDAPQYITFYDKNGKYFPLYFVFGELDNGKMADNSIPLNRYMRSGFDPVIVQYRGRGNEHFYEEIHRIFAWMELHERDSYPEEVEVDSMRPWDNFFWFVEFDGFPARTMVSPFEWPPAKPYTSEISARHGNNRVSVQSGGASLTTIWLTPEIVDFDEKIRISVNGKAARPDIVPDLETILEDARTRADRQHVFWTKVQVQTGKR